MKKKSKVIWVLIDGVGDVTCEKLGNKTPLESAKIPNINGLCAKGLSGIMDPFRPGFSCGSDTAHLSIFGYNPRKYYTGRGCFECMGAGCHLDIGDVGFKCNFASFDQKTRNVYKRRCDRNFEKEGPILCKFLDGLKVPGFEKNEVKIKYATEHRCGIRIRGKNLSNLISGTDPLKDNLALKKCVPTVSKDHEEYEHAKATSDYINALHEEISKKLMTHEINKERIKDGKNPANLVLFRGAGKRLKVDGFTQKYHGMKGFLVAPTCIIAGFGLNIGLDLKKVVGATGDMHSDYIAKGKGFTKIMQSETDSYDFGFLHVKGVDDSSHEGMVNKKVELIEKVDVMIGNLIEDFKNFPRTIIVITGDHSTPCSFKDHSYEPVPFLISELNKQSKFTDGVKAFNETESALGYLGRFTGDQIFPIIQNFQKI